MIDVEKHDWKYLISKALEKTRRENREVIRELRQKKKKKQLNNKSNYYLEQIL